MMNIRRSIKFFFQRCWRGWDDSITWNLDLELAQWLLPRLKRFRELGPKRCGPPYFDSLEEWGQEVDKMIWSLERLTNAKDMYWVSYEGKTQEGLDSIAKYWQYLWW